MGWISDLFFSGVPADIGVATVVIIVAWLAWQGGYNRE